MKKAYCIRESKSPIVNTYMSMLEDGVREAGYETESVGQVYSGLDKSAPILTDIATIALQYMIRGYRKHIVWYQGIIPEESYMRRKSRLRFAALSMIEEYVLKKAQVIILVSKAMLEFYEKKYHISIADKSLIIPCYIDHAVYPGSFDRKGTGQGPEFVYVGGMQEWQCFEQTAAIYQKIEEQLQGECLFSVYSKDPDKARQIMERTGVRNYTVQFVESGELYKRIATADYGFILREDVDVNQVATPTKISNYIANGIVPIYTPAIRSFAEADREIGLGIQCEMEDPDRAARTIVEAIRDRKDRKELESKCRRYFEEYYSRDRHVKEVAEITKRVFG